uniref:Uncharacterized protein n=1 Tax=Magallana gigas TaxID=29159 RepID=K1QPR8_MAGGI
MADCVVICDYDYGSNKCLSSVGPAPLYIDLVDNLAVRSIDQDIYDLAARLPATILNAAQRSEEEVSGLIDQRSKFPLHPGTLHPHGAIPFTASTPVMLQEPHFHPTPHDIYVRHVPDLV